MIIYVRDIYGELVALDMSNVSNGKSAYDIAVSKGFNGTEEEWLVSLKGLKGDKGDTGEQGLPGENGITPDMTAFENRVNTIESKINDHITNHPQDGDGDSNNTKINDLTISKNYTWSSSKTEEFVLNNIGVIWQEINGGQMVIDSTMDGFLREFTITGNTIQNKDNLSDIQHLGVWNEEKQGYEVEIVVSNSSNQDDVNYQDCRMVVILPCQLMKVGKVSDRLYWDKSKGRYIIEKNVLKTNIPVIDNVTNSVIDGNKGCKCSITYYGEQFSKWNKAFTGIPSIETSNHSQGDYMTIQGVQSISTYSNTWFDQGQKGKFFSINHVNANTDNAYIGLLFRNSDCNDIEEMNNWVKSFSNTTAYYRLSTPQLIDTDIREELKLPTFINNTYVMVNGGIKGFIKAKAPIDGGKVIGVLEEENKKLKNLTTDQDELINTTMLVTDEIFMLLEPLLPDTLNEKNIAKITKMYSAMVQRGLKTKDQIPEKYKENVKEILSKLDKKY